MDCKKLLPAAVMGMLIAPVMCAVGMAGESEPWYREGLEIYAAVQTMGSDTVFYGALENRVDSMTAYGVGVGAVSDHLGLSVEFLFGSTSDTYDGSETYGADVVLMNVNIDYFILKGPLTPLLSGGIGLFKMDGQSAGGTPYSESNFSYNFGAGARWDITNEIALEILYRITWTEFDFANSSHSFDGVMVSPAYVFK